MPSYKKKIYLITSCENKLGSLDKLGRTFLS